MNEFDRLVEIMDDLREKCPWDRKQTIQTLRTMTIEETYELANAIEQCLLVYTCHCRPDGVRNFLPNDRSHR